MGVAYSDYGDREGWYEKLLDALDESPYHCNYTDEDIEKFIDTPISLQKYLMGFNDDDGLIFFATFAAPEERHVQEYMRTGRFPVEGFYAEGGDLWCVDFICLGGKRDVLLAFRFLKSLLCSYGYDKCFWLRTEAMKMGYHIIKE